MERDAMMVAGFGFRSGATLASLRDALAHATAALQPAMPAQAIALLATAHDKADAPCLRALADALGVPVCAVEAARMNATATLTDHATVRMLRGSGSTAEAAALAAALIHAGPGAALLHPRAVSTDRLATCALAARTQPPESRP
ncbi:cobalamin biosynthesis protein [Variovorax saccharolyticus]|uniref:cobalamin biosynthesis protein n=1 Tax=Variovorax saccharolyticus TaxID=3053516 RepID=UPI002577B277|nr:cobalamin biosynthesis protein [Variovorax sp. J22R187]MDM0019179.1 cobalamin biosynthesis protein [Variovorax sp. J22R187]